LAIKYNELSFAESVKFGFQTATDEWGTFSEKAVTGSRQLAATMEGSFTNAFTSMIDGTKGFSEAFSQMTNEIASQILRLAVQKAIVQPIMQGMSGLFSMGGSSSAGMMGGWDASFTGNAGLAHLGGMAGSGMQARRMHTGGIVGDEMPIVARRGEAVFTPEQMSALGKAIGGNQKREPVNIVNVFDERMLDEHIAKNPNAILNIIGRNKSAVRAMIA
jgi:hypothetical protein